MRILIVIPGYEPAWALGGVVTSTAMLARALASIGHDITVYTTNVDGQGGEIGEPVGVPVSRQGVKVRYFQPTFGLSTPFDSRGLIREFTRTVTSFDIIYLAATYQWLGIDIPRIASMHGTPVVMFLSGTLNRTHLRRGWLKKKVWFHLFLSKALDRCCALHLASQHELRESRPIIERWDHFVVPHCIELNGSIERKAQERRYRSTLGISESAPVILAAGRFDPLKRIDILLRSLALLKDQHRFHIVVAGDYDSSEGRDLIRLADALGLRSRAHWPGLVDYGEMPSLYSSCDLLVHLSEDENFAMVVAEAMASGLPVLVSRGVGLWDSTMEKRGGECVGLSIDSVAERLKDFFDYRSKWREYGVSAAAIAKERFAPKAVASQMAERFEQIVQRTE